MDFSTMFAQEHRIQGRTAQSGGCPPSYRSPVDSKRPRQSMVSLPHERLRVPPAMRESQPDRSSILGGPPRSLHLKKDVNQSSERIRGSVDRLKCRDE